MEFAILYQPSYSLVRVKLSTGEAITAEAGAMVSMSEGIIIETTLKGGLLAALRLLLRVKSPLHRLDYVVKRVEDSRTIKISFGR